MVIEKKFHLSKGKKEDYSLFGAFPSCGNILFEVYADGFGSVRMVLHSDGLSSENGEKYASFELEKTKDVFSLTLSTAFLVSLNEKGLYYYHYELTDNCGNSVVFAGDKPTDLEKDGWERQLLLYDEKFKTPDFLKQGMIYHIFVDRFKRSGKCKVRDGAVFNPDFETGIPEYPEYRGAELKNNEFFGGDLYGVAEKLDYIKSLGATTVYLSPIFDSPSNHKYDTSDYMKVDEAFGGDEALEYLISECKKRGMYLILDGVFNHTGADSVYFDIYSKYGKGAYSCDNSPYADWYSFGESKDKYECWWNIKILPKVNCDAASYREFIFGENGVVRKYMRMGIDGFRLDVADELSDSFLETMRSTVREENPDGIVLGEVWEDASNKIAYSKRRYYFAGKQLDSVMNYPLREGIIAFIKEGDFEALRFAAECVYRHYPKCVCDTLMNFLGTHDTERILTVLAGRSPDGLSNKEIAQLRMTPEEREKGLRMLRCAFAICALMYGVPSVFYGDEAGVEGYHDPFCRKPFPWGREDKQTQEFFAKLGALRNSEKLFAEGLFRVVYAYENAFVFERFDDKEIITAVVTRGAPFDFECEAEAICILGENEGERASRFTIGKWSVGVYYNKASVN